MIAAVAEAPDESAEWVERHRVKLARPVSDADIVGIGHVMDEVHSVVGRLANADLMTALGADLPRGILFWGPPGTGKTLVARYVASRLGADVPMYEFSADELSPEVVRTLVDQLGADGRRRVLYIDEIDLVALNRRSLNHDNQTRATLVALLAALDGMYSAGGLLLIAASNQSPASLDPALVRPGRLGVHVEFDIPDAAEAARLFGLFLANRPTEQIDLERVGALAEGMEPAAIRAIVDDATGLALADGRQVTGADDLARALRRRGRIEPEQPPRKIDREWLERAAIHEAGHVAVAIALMGPDAVQAVSLHEFGGSTQLAGNDGDAASDWLRQELVVALGGCAAEENAFASIGRGARSDIAGATQLAWELAGIGQLPGAAALDPQVFLLHGGASALAHQATVVISALVAARERAREIVAANSEVIARFASAIVNEYLAPPGSKFDKPGIELDGRRLRGALRAAGLAGRASGRTKHARRQTASSGDGSSADAGEPLVTHANGKAR